MEKIEKGHPLSQSADIVKENIETLKRLFPTIVKEDKIDFNELKALINEEIEDNEEYYRFTWAGKSEARREANKTSTATLRPNKTDSKNWDTTQNIFIEGDNLEVLKLLQKSYPNQIKMIYIDPPYNTGRDFVYKDNYADNLGNYLSLTGQTDTEGRKISTNTESDGRYHSNWLNMMYPRLKLARNLLSDDGVIFVSIDDNESSNTRKILDEIYGENNCVAELIVIRAEGGGLAKQVIKGHDYLYVYAKEINQFQPLKKTKDIRGKREFINGIEFWIEEDWLRKEFGKYGTCLYAEIEKFHGISKKNEIDEGIKNGLYVLINKNGNEIVGRYRKVSEDGTKFYSILKHLNKNGVEDLVKLGLERYFDFPKPLSLIKELVLGATIFTKGTNNIILDFFAGSGTTAHAVMQLNAEDNGNRKTISVQLPEATDESSEAYKAGYQNIAEITKERMRRAGDKIIADKKGELESLKKSMEGKMFQEEIQQKMEQIQTTINHLDIGFKAFKLDSSNIKTWDGNLDQLQNNLFDSQDNIKEDRTEEDLLFEILLKYGLDLTVPIEQKIVENCTIYNIGSGVLFVCISDKITTEVATSIGKWKEELQPTTCRVLFKDNGFKDDVAKTNSIQILRQFGIEECNSI